VVGRLIEHKRVDMVLDAVAILRARGQDITCRVVGSGPQAAELRTRTMRLGLLTAVDFRDDVSSQDDLFDCVKSSEVLVLASEREGFGIAALEGLACGVSVVTTSAPDNLAQHLVAQAPRGFVCEPAAEPLADTIGRALANRQHPTSEGMYDWFEPYTWNAAATSTADVLNDVYKRSMEQLSQDER
jgi:glycosyltransferase involved in cell wall biosynthesis